MESLAGKTLPTGEKGTYEVKLDGFRAVAVRTDQIVLYSRQGKVLTSQFIPIAQELEKLPPETVLDGELVALDENGAPRFNLLQNYRTGFRDQELKSAYANGVWREEAGAHALNAS